MTIRFFRPHPALCDVIARFYVHESDGRAMTVSPWVIVPDGELKLIFPFRGAIRCTIGVAARWHAESRFIVSGMRDVPGSLTFPEGVGAVGAILHADALHRLSGVPQRTMTNRTLDGEELFGALVREWHDKIDEAPSVEDRVACLERLLKQALERTRRPDSCFEWALRQIRATDGRIRIEELAKELGWSRRRLDRAFAERVGVPPKRLAGILRFRAVHRHLTREPPERQDRRLVYRYYYDQSHFLKAFRQFSGYTPRGYEHGADYGRFYVP